MANLTIQAIDATEQSFGDLVRSAASRIYRSLVNLGQLGKRRIPGMARSAFAEVMRVGLPTGELDRTLLVEQTEQHPMGDPDGAPKIVLGELLARELERFAPIICRAGEDLDRG